MKKNISALFFIILISAISASASQSNFMISPSPIPWYEFQQGQADIRLGGSYVSVTGETDPATGDKPSIEGGGLSFAGRYAFNNNIAVDFLYNFVGAGGSLSSNIDLEVYLWLWNPNIEFQLVNNEKFKFIVFLGPIWSLASVTLYDYSTYPTNTLGVTAYMDGIQFGFQASMILKPFVVAPFFLYQKMSGSADVNGISVDIPSVTMKSYGIDLIYLPWNLTLSSIMQQVATSGNNGGYKTFYVSLSYDFRWGGKEYGNL